MSGPLISVVIPCYNHGRFLESCVRSVQCQTLQDWECIIVDDGSDEPGLSDVVGRVTEDARVRVVRQPNLGLGRARNTGLTQARGRYVQFLDADDVLMPAKFSRQLDAIGDGDDGLGVAYCDYQRLERTDDDAETLVQHDPQLSVKLPTDEPLRSVILDWETRLSIPIHCFLFDRRLFSESELTFDPRLVNHEDWEFLTRVLASHPRIAFVDQALVAYRIHGANMSADLGRMKRGFLEAIQLARHRTSDPAVSDWLRQKQAAVRRSYARRIWIERRHHVRAVIDARAPRTISRVLDRLWAQRRS